MGSSVPNNPGNVHDILRAGLCILCRTTLGQAEPCDQCGAQSVVSLHQRTGRARAHSAAWVASNSVDGPRGWLGPLVALSLCCLVAAAGWWWFQSTRAAGIVLLIAAAFVIPLTFRVLRKPASDKRPAGATLNPKPPERARGIEGVATALEGQSGPLAVSHILRLGTQQVTLRDAYTDGFMVTTATGEQLMVPRGRIRVQIKKRDLTEANPEEVERLLALCDPSRTIMAEQDVFPYDSAERGILSAGARVRVNLGQATEVPWVEALG